MNIPKRLKEARKTIGYSYTTAAIKSGISHREIRLFEDGYLEPTFSELSKLADTYKITTDFLMGDKPMEKLNFIHCKRN